MNTIQLSKLLYNIDEVKYSLMLSILFPKKHALHECLFWAYELYTSYHKEFLWNFITKLYYDFYYIKCISFERKIDDEYNKWKKEKRFEHIAKIVKILHKQVIDVTIFQYYYSEFIPIKNSKIGVKKLKENIPDTINYLKSLDIQHIKEIYSGLYRLNNKKDICLFYTNQKHKWIIKLLTKFIKKPKKSIKENFNKQDELFINQLKCPASCIYKTLKEKRLYEINPLIGTFKLARFKNETDVVTIWNEDFGYIPEDVERYKSAYLYNWEFYANKTPYWKEIFNSYKVSFKKKEIKFPNDDLLEQFYDNYGYEPDEQNIETQMKSIQPIKPITINDCFNVYNTTLKESIKQITYCIN